jgi:hypothetical protein
MHIYRVSQEVCARLQEGVPCGKVYGYGDNGQRSLKL